VQEVTPRQIRAQRPSSRRATTKPRTRGSAEGETVTVRESPERTTLNPLGGAGRVRSSSAFRMNCCSRGSAGTGASFASSEERQSSSAQANRCAPAAKIRAPLRLTKRTASPF